MGKHMTTCTVCINADGSVVYSGLGDSMEVDGGAVDLGRLQERFSLEYTNLYIKIADVARQQSNYAVCCKYLGLTEKAINEVCSRTYICTCMMLIIKFECVVCIMGFDSAVFPREF